MATSGKSREIKKKQQSLKEPTRRKRHREEEEAGVTKQITENVQENRYNHNIQTLQLSPSIIGKAGKKLCKLQEDIRRKEQKVKSRWLEKCKQDYDHWFEEMVKELKQLMAIVGEREVLHQQKAEIDSLKHDLKQQKEVQEKKEETIKELTRKLDSLNQDLKQQKETEQKNEETNRELKRKIDSLNQDLKQQKGTIQNDEEKNRELQQKLDSVKEELSREQEAKVKALTSLKEELSREEEAKQKALTSLDQTLKQLKEIEHKNEETTGELNRKLDSTDKNRKLLEETEQRNEETTRALTQQLDSLNEELSQEREAKQDALTRLSAITSSRLRDNNPNLTDLSDPYRPSKLGEMFSELYDNEWTNAYDELNECNSEVETIEQLNAIAMTAYDCCMTLFKPCGSYLDTDLTKIESELRQKIIGHFKRNGMVVIQHLSQGLENDICVRCKMTKATDQVAIYIRKCIVICWLMVIQDPPIVLDNSKPEKFDTSRFKGYMHNGPYTDYVVWPAVNLYKKGPLLSKGVAEGRK